MEHPPSCRVCFTARVRYRADKHHSKNFPLDCVLSRRPGCRPRRSFDCTEGSVSSRSYAATQAMIVSRRKWTSLGRSFNEWTIPFCIALAIVLTFRYLVSFRERPQITTITRHGLTKSVSPATPACRIWEDWRHVVPSSVPANDSSLHKSRMGTSEVMGDALGQGCIPAKERLGPFGYSDLENENHTRSWDDVQWGLLQAECAEINFPKLQTLEFQRWPPRLRRAHEWLDSDLSSPDLDDLQTGRTAIVLRAWDGYEHDQNQRAWLRTVITEAALDTGGRFQVFMLVHIKDQDLDLSINHVYKKSLEDSVPEEFKDLALLFNEDLLREWYPKVSDHGAQDQMYQALQIFSHTFPEYDFLWQIEMDARFTGNVATMLTNAGLWAEQQPRKNLWERNARWFVPGMFSNYSDFSARVDEEFSDDTGVWGPAPGAEHYVEPRGPTPPDRQQTTWGVGEAADLITFAPMIDPIGSNWTYEHSIHGFANPDTLPRRMAIVSMTRTSRRLLRLISSEQRERSVWVVSESTPETWSFLHGLKAVYVPHLFTFNFEAGDMSPQELDQMVHKGPPHNLAGGPKTGFVWCENGMGIPEGRWLSASYFYWACDAPNLWWEYTNGSCSYPLLLHPVKQG